MRLNDGWQTSRSYQQVCQPSQLEARRGATSAPAGVTDDGSVSWPAVPVVLKCSNDDKTARLTLELWETVRPK